MGYVLLIIFILIILLCLVYGVLSTNKFTVKKADIQLCNLPDGFADTRILHISDLHNSYFGKENSLLADKIRELHPDYICVSGDCIDRFSQNGDAFIALLKNLDGEFPVFYSLGNHDVIVKKKNFIKYCSFMNGIKACGVNVMDDEYTVLERGGDKLYLFGLTPVREENAKELTPELIVGKIGKCPVDVPVILITHEGNLFENFANWGASLCLCGHIHGGIIRLPFFGGVFGEGGRLFPKYDRGVYELDGKQMNLSSGLGYTKFKLRFLNSPEMTLIELKTPSRKAV